MDNANPKIVESYYELRDMVIQLSSNRLGGEIQGERTIVAVLMEFARPQAVVTLAAIADGTASLYFSSGGGVIGAGENELVRMVALDFIDVAAYTGKTLEETISCPLPQQGFVRFYVVGLGYVLTAEVLEEALKDNANPLSRLFCKGHELISAIRLHEKQNTLT